MGSRARFESYREKVNREQLPKGSIHSTGESRNAKDRVRSASKLVWEFLDLLNSGKNDQSLGFLIVAGGLIVIAEKREGAIPPNFNP